MSIDTSELDRKLAFFQDQMLLSTAEANQLQALFADQFGFYNALQRADSLHVHIKVDNVDQLPQQAIVTQGGVIENTKPGYVKYAFADGVHFIFSSINVSQEDLMDLPRPGKPFVDHFGIDLRRETPESEAMFASIPAQARALGWETTAQGGADKPVFCCHVQVKAKHWVYPTRETNLPPIEFAYGPLTISGEKSGCDLRPANPALLNTHKSQTASCGGAPSSTCKG